MINEDLILELEQESDAPENWITNTILVRNEKGEIIEVEVPDDTEEG
jgi:hypothetical protein